MKKITFTIFAIMLCSIGYIKAQTLDTIPNGDFERWKGIGQAKESPQGWDTLGGISYPVTDVAYEKDLQYQDHYVWDGKLALSLTSETKGGLIYVGRVESKFKVKHKDPYMIMNMAYFEAGGPQTPIIDVIFWNSKTHDTVCAELFTFNNWQTVQDTFQPWSTVNFPLAYTYRNNGVLGSGSDTTTPDSCHILLLNAVPANGIGSPATPAFYVEKMWFASAAATTGIDINDKRTSQSTTCQVYPNPFTNKTTIHYNITQEGQVNLTVYDMDGREIKTLVNGNQSPGLYNQTFDANGLSNGVYMYRLQTSSGTQTGKLILTK